MSMKSSPELVAVLADQFNVTPDQIEGFILTVQLPGGAAVLHTLCCNDHMQAALRSMLDITPEPYPNGPN